MKAAATLSLALLLLGAEVPSSREGLVRRPPDTDEKDAGLALGLEEGSRTDAGLLELDTFLASLPLREDGNRVLTRRRVIETVLRQHLRIRMARERWLAAAAEARIEEARFDPAVFGRVLRGESKVPTSSAFSRPFVIESRDDLLEVGVRKGFRQGLDLSTSFVASRFASNSTFQGLQPEYGQSVLVEAVLPLLRGAGTFVNTADLRSARLEAEAEHRLWEAEAALVTAGSEILYWELVGTLEILRMREGSIDRVSRLLGDARSRLEAGVVPISEVRQAESALAARQEDRTRARRAVERVVDTLATNLRIGEDVKVWELPVRTQPLPGAPEELPDLEALTRRAASLRSEIEAAELTERAEALEAEAARRERRPRLDLVADVEVLGISGGAVTFTDFTGGAARSPFGGPFNEGVDRLVEGDFRDWSLALEVSWPIGNRAAEARHAREVHEAREAELARMRQEDLVRFEVLDAYKDLAAAVERARVAERFVDLAGRAVTDERTRFGEGLSNVFRILELEDDLSDAEVRLVDARVDIQRARVALDLAVGRYLESRGLRLPDVVPGEVLP